MEAFLKRVAYGWHGPILIDQGFLSHLGWAFAVPLFGFWLGGRRWLRIAAMAWIASAVWRELVEEALDATTISDLVSRIAPVLLLVAIDAVWTPSVRAYSELSDPSRSTTSTRPEIFAIPLVAVPTSSGRTPSVTSVPGCRFCASFASGTVTFVPPGRRTVIDSGATESTAPLSRFILGEPMNPATNTF